MSTLSPSIKQELERIDQLILKGEYSEALKDIKEIQENKDLTQEEGIKTKLLECKVEKWMGIWGEYFAFTEHRFEKTINLANETLEESTKINNLLLMSESLYNLAFAQCNVLKNEDCPRTFEKYSEIYEKIKSKKPDSAKEIEPYFCFLKGTISYALFQTGREVSKGYQEESIQHLEDGLKKANKQKNQYAKIFLLWALGYYHQLKGNQERWFENRQEFVEFSEEIGNKYLIGHSLNILSQIYYTKGEYEKFLELQMKRLNIYEDLGYEVGIATVNTSLGYYFLAKGEKDQALENFFKTLNFSKEVNNETRIGWSSSDVGLIYRMKGNLELAFKYTKKAYDIITVFKPEAWWYILTELSEVYVLMGELDEALKLQEELLEFHKNSDIKEEIALALHNIGKIYWHKGLKNQAIEIIQESSILVEELGDNIRLGLIFADLIYFLTEINEMDTAINYLAKLGKINADIKNKELGQKYSYSEALVLRISSDTREKIKAEVILERLLREEIDYEFQLSILLVLCEMLLSELQASGDIQILNRIQKYILDLYALTAGNNSYILSSEVLLLQARLALVELDTEKTAELLDKAEKIAEEKGLDRLKDIITQERANIEGEIGKIEQLDKTALIRKRMEVIDLKKSMNGIKKASVTDTKVEKSDLSDKLFSIRI